VTAARFGVLGMTVPRLELFAQSFGARRVGRVYLVGDRGRAYLALIAGELARHAEFAEVTDDHETRTRQADGRYGDLP
jgi:hypothetical protein